MFVEFVHGEKYAQTGADTADTPDSFDDCGLLLTDEDLVIDIDCLPKETIKQLLKDFMIETQVVWTDRGAHLYFQKPAYFKPREGVCRLGFKVEQFTKRQRPNGVTIKRNGVMREVENWGVREEFASIFNVSANYHNLLGLQEGEGRNAGLFAQNVALNRCESWDKILKFINQNVLGEPLNNDEFLTATRDIEKTAAKGAEEVEIAEEILKTMRVSKWGGKVWYWDPDSQSYTDNEDYLMDVICSKCPGRKTAFIEEVHKQLQFKGQKYPPDYTFKIKLQNGFLWDGQFYSMTLTDFTPYSIPIPYNPDARPAPLVDDYLEQLAASEKYSREEIEEYKNLILESMAYGLVVNPERTRSLCRFFIFRGEGANGKGTLLQIIRRIYGKQNCASMSITQLSDDKFNSQLPGRLVNLGDDLEGKPINEAAFRVIKNITSADTFQTRPMYQNPLEVVVQTKLLFTTNNNIRTFEKGYALDRRICWMPMFNTVKKPDPNFISKLTTPEVLEYWMKLLVEAYLRLYKDGWTPSKIAAGYNEKYRMHNDLSLLFLEEMGIESLLDMTMTEISKAFDEWNTEDDRKLNKKAFKMNCWNLYKAGIGIARRTGAAKTFGRVLMLQSETTQDLTPTFK